MPRLSLEDRARGLVPARPRLVVEAISKAVTIQLPYSVRRATSASSTKPWQVWFELRTYGPSVVARYVDEQEANAHAGGMNDWYARLPQEQRDRIWPADRTFSPQPDRRDAE